jgi:acetoacetate decarboxylase
MNINREKINIMPLLMGPLFDREERPPLVYADTESLILQFQSEPEAIQSLLPDCFKATADATVRILILDSQGVSFMAGNGYRLASVQVAARFDGEKDHLNGDFVLVMFENETTPIITGREHLGIPKFYADISGIRTLEDGHLRCEVSLWGHLLFGIELSPLKSQRVLARKIASKRSSEWPSFGYKYIASLDGPPDADYPTILWNDVKVEQLWLGKTGNLFFGNPDESDIGYYKRVVDALKSLPVHAVTMTSRTRGSSILRYDKCRRIR